MFVTVFKEFESVHLTKDVGMIPISASSIFGVRSKIFYLDNGGVISGYSEHVEVIPVRASSGFYFYLKVFWVLMRLRPSIVCLFHCRKSTLRFALLLRMVGLKCFVKGDMDNKMGGRLEAKYSAGGFFSLLWRRMALLSVSFITVEQDAVFSRLKGVGVLGEKVRLLPNAIEPLTVPVEPLGVRERENTILVVGRVGAHQKNHELALEAWVESNLNMSGWKLKICGPKTNDLLDRFFADHPDCGVEYLGNIGREELFDLYSKSKVFLMTSRSEGFSIALLEAAYMGCYIVSTDIGGASQVTNGGALGSIVDGNSRSVSRALTSTVCSGKLEGEYLDRLNYVRSEFNLRSLLSNLFYGSRFV